MTGELRYLVDGSIPRDLCDLRAQCGPVCPPALPETLLSAEAKGLVHTLNETLRLVTDGAMTVLAERIATLAALRTQIEHQVIDLDDRNRRVLADAATPADPS